MTRRRQPNIDGGRPGRHNVKTTPAQEAAILMGAAAQGVTPARFLVEAAVAVAQAEHAGTPETVTARRAQVQQLFALQGQIGEIAWQARKVGVNVNQIAKAAHQGTPVPVEEMRAFLAAERDHLTHARQLYDRIGGLIDECAAQGVAA